MHPQHQSFSTHLTTEFYLENHQFYNHVIDFENSKQELNSPEKLEQAEKLIGDYKNYLTGVSGTAIDKARENIRDRSTNFFIELKSELFQILQLRYLEWCDSLSEKNM